MALEAYLKYWRSKSNASISDLANSKMNKKTLEEIEKGNYRSPSIKRLQDLSEAYKFSLGHLMYKVFGVEPPITEIDQRQVYKMDFNEMIESIFIRCQIMEALMRDLISKKGRKIEHDALVRMSFGQLLRTLESRYPEISVWTAKSGFGDLSLLSYLESAKDLRDSAAHGDYLVHLTISELLVSYGGAVSADRIAVRSARKSLFSIDDALIKIKKFHKLNVPK